jgi:glycosyltransferase involved in cell wall biosynthesis
MIVTVLSPSAPVPMGGVSGIIDFANALSRRGHEVHLAHVDLLDSHVDGPEDLAWCPIDDAVTQHYGREPHELDIEGSVAVVGFDDRLPAHLGEPAMFVQAYRILPPEVERVIYRTPVPKLCTSSWLRQVAIRLGNPAAQTFHVPYVLRTEKYRASTPLADRPKRVCMLLSRHPLKNASLGLDALDDVRRLDPSVEVVVFGVGPRPRRLPDAVEYRTDPSQATLVDEIYDRSAIFVSPAHLEGFGLAALEAMACGCVLVTTDNGGSWDYAVDGETAAVVAGDREAMAARILDLLADTDARVAMAEAGMARAGRFTSDESGRILEDVLTTYLADPPALRRPVPDRYDEVPILSPHDARRSAVA